SRAPPGAGSGAGGGAPPASWRPWGAVGAPAVLLAPVVGSDGVASSLTRGGLTPASAFERTAMITSSSTARMAPPLLWHRNAALRKVCHFGPSLKRNLRPRPPC